MIVAAYMWMARNGLLDKPVQGPGFIGEFTDVSATLEHLGEDYQANWVAAGEVSFTRHGVPKEAPEYTAKRRSGKWRLMKEETFY